LENCFEQRSSHWLPSSKNKHGRLDVHIKTKVTPIYNPYCELYTTPYMGYSVLVLIYCHYFVSRGTSVCAVTILEIPNPRLQSALRYKVGLLVVSSYFLLCPSCPSIVGEPVVGSWCDPHFLNLGFTSQWWCDGWRMIPIKWYKWVHFEWSMEGCFMTVLLMVTIWPIMIVHWMQSNGDNLQNIYS